MSKKKQKREIQIDDLPEHLLEGIDRDEVNPTEYVKDWEAYDKWKKAEAHPLLNEKRHWKASDGRTINIGRVKSDLIRDMEGLPDKEQEKFLKLKKQYYKVQGQANAQKRLAFNIASGKKSATNWTSILDTRKADVIALFGRLFTVPEAHKIIVTDWKMPVGRETLSRFRKENALEIDKAIEEYKSKYTDVRLGHKRSRLEELSWIYDMLKDKFKDLKSREDARAMIAIIEQIRKEIDGDELKINLEGNIKVQEVINIQIQKELMNGIGLRQIIIGRVAAKMGLPTEVLINSLTRSYYNKMSGALDAVEDIDYEDVHYPSEDVYDFDRINKLNKSVVIEDKETIRKSKLKEEKQSEDAIKSHLKDRLLKLNEDSTEEIQERKRQVRIAGVKRDGGGQKVRKPSVKVKSKKKKK